MRSAFLLALALAACAKNDTPATDSAAGQSAPETTATHSPLTASDVAGTWTGTSMAESTDSVTNRWVSMRDNDSTAKLVMENSKDTITYTVVYDADSMVATSKPYATVSNPKTKVIFRSVGRLRGDTLSGTLTTMLAAKPDSVVARGRWTATKKP